MKRLIECICWAALVIIVTTAAVILVGITDPLPDEQEHPLPYQYRGHQR